MSDSKKTVILKQDEQEIVKVDLFTFTPKDDDIKMVSFKYIPYGAKVMSVNVKRETFCKQNDLPETTTLEELKKAFTGKVLHLSNTIIL